MFIGSQSSKEYSFRQEPNSVMHDKEHLESCRVVKHASTVFERIQHRLLQCSEDFSLNIAQH